MQLILIIVLIFIAIWAWPVTLGIVSLWIVYAIVKAIVRRSKERARNVTIQEVAPQVRESLQQDRELLVSVIAEVIRQHWNVLEDKFEQYTDEDDYGNVYVNNGLRKEFVYFSDKVVLPELQHRIDSGKTSNNSVALILSDTLYVLQHITEGYFGIKFEDSDETIASKLLENVADNSHMDDELLYTLHTQPEVMETYTSQATGIFMQDSSITLSFHEKLKTSQPMSVPPFVALVFVLFSAMHNNKSSAPKEHHETRTFTGNDPYKYEEFIKGLLRSRGFTAKRTPSSGDFGVDVVASKDGKSFAIQCKLYNRPVGTKAIQEVVSGRIFYKTDFAVVVSDNSFTPAAKTLARKSDVMLTHHKNLLHKLEGLLPAPTEDVMHDDKPADLVDTSVDKEQPAKKQWTQQDADELITVILPTITNDK